MKRACIIYSDQCLRHGTEGHVENFRRLTSVMAGLKAPELSGLADIVTPGRASQGQLIKVHHPNYVLHVETFGTGMLDPDTEMTDGSLDAARLAAGAAVDAVEEVRNGRELAFGLIRPPGHHALPDRAMGFCLFNNAAVGAAQALAHYSKVLIVDWDVHHGNGTEQIFYGTPDVLYFSVHQSPHFPYTGAVGDAGEGEGEGYNVNIPLPPGSTDADYLEAFLRVLAPIADDYRPDLVIVSAGYDPAEGDPLGDMRMTPRGFQKLAYLVRSITRANGVIALLEGGYSALLPDCVAASIRGFLGEDAEISLATTAAARSHVDEAVRAQRQYWRL
ncbi:histone deacetylase family protein [Methanocella sp. MCL-LM]|uniref:histone deacetylase family protein n=1 Tax=Methanocella sp. MCL-LM TaxID=3412035 RepID=UPI003C7211CE